MLQVEKYLEKSTYSAFQLIDWFWYLKKLNVYSHNVSWVCLVCFGFFYYCSFFYYYKYYFHVRIMVAIEMNDC